MIPIPFILTIIGGYLIGDSALQFKKGGRIPEKVKRFIDLQNQVNKQIDEKGEADHELADELERVADSLNSHESELAIELYMSKKYDDGGNVDNDEAFIVEITPEFRRNILAALDSKETKKSLEYYEDKYGEDYSFTNERKFNFPEGQVVITVKSSDYGDEFIADFEDTFIKFNDFYDDPERAFESSNLFKQNVFTKDEQVKLNKYFKEMHNEIKIEMENKLNDRRYSRYY